MGGWRFLLSIIIFFLCVCGGRGQEISTDETIWSEEVQPAQKTTSRIQFPKDRKPSGISKRIIGGSVATSNEYPYQVALYIQVQGLLYFCGGTLITTEWVLTAAHCVEGASSIQVLLGAHDISQVEATRVSLTSTTFIIHAGWNETILQNDIALIRLPENVTLTSNITTVEIAEGSDTYSGVLGRCLGWGRTILGVLSSVLRYLDAEVITNESCSSYADYAGYIVNHHLCTSGEGFVGSCNGDSGGPLIINGIQVGIVSFGVTDCAAGVPSVFTRVTDFRSWISENIVTTDATTASDATTTTDATTTRRNGSPISVPFLLVYVGAMLTVICLNYSLKVL